MKNAIISAAIASAVLAARRAAYPGAPAFARLFAYDIACAAMRASILHQKHIDKQTQGRYKPALYNIRCRLDTLFSDAHAVAQSIELSETKETP